MLFYLTTRRQEPDENRIWTAVFTDSFKRKYRHSNRSEVEMRFNFRLIDELVEKIRQLTRMSKLILWENE